MKRSNDSPLPSYGRTLLILLLVLILGAIGVGIFLPSLAKSKARAQRVSGLHQLELLESDWLFRSAVRHDTESYDSIVENPFLDPALNPLSTFGLDVDTASYSNIRRFLDQGRLPDSGAVRIEEMINYFAYTYPPPTDGRHFCPSCQGRTSLLEISRLDVGIHWMQA